MPGHVPPYLKHANIQPLLKKMNLEPSPPQNYRPISKLSLIATFSVNVVKHASSCAPQSCGKVID